MKKQVKVNVRWNDTGVCLSTNKGKEWYFATSNRKHERSSCGTIVSSLVSSLILPTVKAAFDASDSNEFSFEFKVMDKKES